MAGRFGDDSLLNPAPSDVINGPLTSVLQQLSIPIDPTPQSSVKGLLLRPDYYVQHKDKGVPVKNLDHTKLFFNKLMSGIGRVLMHLSKTGGNVTSYIEHFSFVTLRAGAHNFVDSAYVGYDRHLVDQVINGEAEKYAAGDLFGVALHFHVGNVVQPKPSPSFARGGRGRGFRRGRNFSVEGDRPGNHDGPVHGTPDNICYKYNYKTCTGKCVKLHVCRMCKGNHKAVSGQCNPVTK